MPWECVKLRRGLRLSQALANVRGVNPLLALALLAIAGLAATRLSWLRLGSLSRLDTMSGAGLALLLIGLALGPGIGVLDRRAMQVLTPITALAVGCLGACIGARCEWRLVRRIPRPTWWLGAVQAVAVLAVVGGGVWGLTRAVPTLRTAWAPILPVALTLGAVAVASGPNAVALTARAAAVSRRGARAFALAAAIDAALAVLAFTLTLALFHRREPNGGVEFGRIAWLVLTIGSGVLVGMVFISLIRVRPAPEHLGLALLGTMLFGAGAAYAAGSSPLIVCAIAAALIVNRSPQRRVVRARLDAWEPVATTVLFLTIGALLSGPTPWLLPAAIGLAVLRGGVRWAVVHFGRVPLGATRLPPQVGLATTAQGGLALAIAVSFFLIYPRAAGEAVLTTVVVGVILAQLVAVPLLAWSFRGPALTAPQPAADLS